MKHDRQRMLAPAQSSDQIISHARTKRRERSENKEKQRNSRVEPFDKQNAQESQNIAEPLKNFDAFLEQKDGDNRRKNRRQILNRHRRSERNILHGEKKEIQSGRAEQSAQKQQFPVWTFPIGIDLPQSDVTKNHAESAPEKDDFHRRQVWNLFDENVRQRKAERRDKHRTHAPADKFRIGFCLIQNGIGESS